MRLTTNEVKVFTAMAHGLYARRNGIHWTQNQGKSYAKVSQRTIASLIEKSLVFVNGDMAMPSRFGDTFIKHVVVIDWDRLKETK